jgi:thymidylate synthase (FAD)
MKVKLISLTQSNILTEDKSRLLTPEEHISFCARVSNPSNQLNVESAPKLLGYCIKNKHFSIFEQVFMGVEIVTSRAIAQQILRHRSFTFQEFSQRYSVATKLEPIEFRIQAEKNRQSSTNIIKDGDLEKEIQQYLDHGLNLYNKLIEKGVAKECSRFILPLTTETTLYMTGSIRSWLSYLNVRLDEHTQKEHRLIGNDIAGIFSQNFPNISEATNSFNNFTGNFM